MASGTRRSTNNDSEAIRIKRRRIQVRQVISLVSDSELKAEDIFYERWTPIVERIVSYLDPKDLFTCMNVCKLWRNDIVHSRLYWKIAFRKVQSILRATSHWKVDNSIMRQDWQLCLDLVMGDVRKMAMVILLFSAHDFTERRRSIRPSRQVARRRRRRSSEPEFIIDIDEAILQDHNSFAPTPYVIAQMATIREDMEFFTRYMAVLNQYYAEFEQPYPWLMIIQEAIKYAATYHKWGMVEYLIVNLPPQEKAKLKSWSSSASQEYSLGLIPLVVMNGCLKLLLVLIEYFSKYSFLFATNLLGQGVLHIAAEAGHLEVFQVLQNLTPRLIMAYDMYFNTPLHVACLHGKINIVEHLIASFYTAIPEYRQMLMAVNYQNETALHLAAEMGHLEVVELLVSNIPQSALCRTIPAQTTPLFLAVKNGHLSVVKFLLVNLPRNALMEKDGGNNSALQIALREVEPVEVAIELAELLAAELPTEALKATNLNGDTALHLASQDKIGNNGIQIIATLCQRLEPDNIAEGTLAEGEGEGGFTALHFAALHGRFLIFKIVIAKMTLEGALQPSFEGDTALHLASKFGHFNIVEYLVTHIYSKVPVGQLEKPNDKRKTPLQLASSFCLNEFLEVIELLLRRLPQAGLSEKIPERTLVWAAKKGYLEFAKFLLDNMADDRKGEREEGTDNTALHVALVAAHFELAEMLATKLPIEVLRMKNCRKNTALHMAARLGDGTRHVISMLGQRLYQDDLMAVNGDESTPLHLACTMGHYLCAETLISCPKMTYEGLVYRDSRGNTPLHLAVQWDNERIMKLLLDKLPLEGLYPRNKNNFSPLDLAKNARKKEAIQLIKQAMQKKYRSRGLHIKFRFF